MSIKSWKKEFYRIDAEEFEPTIQTIRPFQIIRALNHSILKWSGTSPSNLKKHNVLIGDNYIIDTKNGECFSFLSDTCALCVLVNENCKSCPIYSVNKKSCYKEFYKFIKDGNGKPMLNLLKKTLHKLKRK